MASSRKKTNGKVVLILFFLILIILLAWYYLFYDPTLANIEVLKIDIETKQSEVDLLKTQLAKQNQMLNDIEYLKTINPAVPAYDNYKQIATVLNVILAQSNLFNVGFTPPSISSTVTAPGVNTARRVLSVSFEADTYQLAKDIIEDIKDIPFRLQISNVNISMAVSNIYVPASEEGGEEELITSLGNAPVSASFKITFFENKYSDE